MATITLTEQDIDDFNQALSMVFTASRLDDIESVDDGVHIRNLCREATTRLCAIRNRQSHGIELGAQK